CRGACSERNRLRTINLMTTRPHTSRGFGSFLAWSALIVAHSAYGSLAVARARADTLTQRDGQTVTGTLANDPNARIVFQPPGGRQPVPLEAGMVVSFDGQKPG